MDEMNKNCNIKVLGEKEYRCFFELTLQVIGGKWKPIIVYQLAMNGVMRFGELKRAIPAVTERMLTRQLRELEKDGLIHREVYREIPPKVEYSLLPAGVQLIPILLQMREWGEEYERSHLPGDYTDDRFEPRTPPVISERYQQFLE